MDQLEQFLGSSRSIWCSFLLVLLNSFIFILCIVDQFKLNFLEIFFLLIYCFLSLNFLFHFSFVLNTIDAYFDWLERLAHIFSRISFFP